MTPKDDNINFDDISEITDAEAKKATIGQPITNFAVNIIPEKSKKVQKTIRFDADVLVWFQENHAHYQTQINSVLRHYYEAHRNK